MAKRLFIAEKPSVAQEFAKALKVNTSRRDGYLEGEEVIITWCVGHLVTMSYPEVYDKKYKRWSLDTLPFLPKEYLYEVIPSVKKQFQIVSSLLNRDDVGMIYVCTDSGREGEYIYRLVEEQAHVKGKTRRRVWIDSQTEEEILRGIDTAKDLSEYDHLSEAAYLRAKEDYLMGINFSRLLTLKYGNLLSQILGTKYTVISVGRVMTCVLGMIVRREREIRQFVKTPFYRVVNVLEYYNQNFEGEFRALENSSYFLSPKLYKENGFKKREDAEELIRKLSIQQPLKAVVCGMEKKQEKKSPPLLYNLAELQNDCSKILKMSPDETLRVVQELYEKKLVTYPRTDARVLSTAVAKEIQKNIKGLKSISWAEAFVQEILENGSYKKITSTKYVNDKLITDHYAIVPTGQGVGVFRSLSDICVKVYYMIVRRFLSIFYPAAVYQKIGLITEMSKERFYSNFKVLVSEGYLKVSGTSQKREDEKEEKVDAEFVEILKKLRPGTEIAVKELQIKEGETSPPKRYNSGSMILAMENAGQLIEDEELRAQIKGSGIGTSATRAEILKKLAANKYIILNKKTQILTPSFLGEMIYEVVNASIKSLLNPELTASWEKGLTYVSAGEITSEEYMMKLTNFIRQRTENVMQNNHSYILRNNFRIASDFYEKKQKGKKERSKNENLQN